MQEHDAERRVAILRGEEPPSPQKLLDAEIPRQQGRSDDASIGSDRRKRRRLAGEDDTDRDIRIAREDTDRSSAALQRLSNVQKRTKDIPLHDQDGHINLFPLEAGTASKGEKNLEVESEKRRKAREFEDQYTMRFSNAAGKDGLEQPWYANRGRVHNEQRDTVDSEGPLMESRNVWGNPDPRRKLREQARSSTNDPLAFMKKAQTQLKQSEQDRKTWNESRLREARKLERLHRSESQSESIPGHDDDLEGFSLDKTYSGYERRAQRRRDDNKVRGHGRSRNRSREPRSRSDRTDSQSHKRKSSSRREEY